MVAVTNHTKHQMVIKTGIPIARAVIAEAKKKVGDINSNTSANKDKGSTYKFDVNPELREGTKFIRSWRNSGIVSLNRRECQIGV